MVSPKSAPDGWNRMSVCHFRVACHWAEDRRTHSPACSSPGCVWAEDVFTAAALEGSRTQQEERIHKDIGWTREATTCPRRVKRQQRASWKDQRPPPFPSFQNGFGLAVPKTALQSSVLKNRESVYRRNVSPRVRGPEAIRLPQRTPPCPAPGARGGRPHAPSPRGLPGGGEGRPARPLASAGGRDGSQ